MAGYVLLAAFGVLCLGAGTVMCTRTPAQLSRGELKHPDQIAFGLALCACGGAFLIAAVMSLPPGWWVRG
jgi:hypothetical protein